MTRLLIVEDEPAMVTGLRDTFEHEGFEVLAAVDGEAGLDLALAGNVDVIILDLMLPKMDGMRVCKELRERNVQTPIIMLTARGEEADRVAGLELGADDYVTKPFSVDELVARVHAVLRRFQSDAAMAEQVRIGEVIVDLKQYAIVKGTERHALTDQEVNLLRLFLQHPHEVISRDSLLNEAWGYNAYPTTRTVDTFVYRLRQMIEKDPQHPRHLTTVRGVGYKFVP